MNLEKGEIVPERAKRAQGLSIGICCFGKIKGKGKSPGILLSPEPSRMAWRVSRMAIGDKVMVCVPNGTDLRRFLINLEI